MTSKKTIAVGTVLFAVIGVQGYYLYHLSQRVNQMNPTPVASVDSHAPTVQNSPTPDPFNFSTTMNWDPFKDIQQMENEMNKVFGNMRSHMQMTPGFGKLNDNFTFSPDVDVKEVGNNIVVTADIPGSDEANIAVKVENQQLVIDASTKKSTQQKDKDTLFRSERFIGQFERSIPLPDPVIASKMHTDYKDGVLTITLPKA